MKQVYFCIAFMFNQCTLNGILISEPILHYENTFYLHYILNIFMLNTVETRRLLYTKM